MKLNKNENDEGSVFNFKGCEMDWKRWTCLNLRIINIVFVLVHLYLLKKDTKGERGEEKMIYDIDKNRVLFCVLCFVFCRDVGNGWIRFPWKQ